MTLDGPHHKSPFLSLILAHHEKLKDTEELNDKEEESEKSEKFYKYFTMELEFTQLNF